MRAVSLLFLLAAILCEVHGQCYLENANAECSVCWETSYSAADDKTGVTTMSECPTTIAVTWDREPPEEMFAGTSYPVEYSINISPDAHQATLAAKKTTTIPHANIHSCIASRGACTPFVANSPGLATHTSELTGDFDANGRAEFSSDVTLTAEVYTIIGHARFYVPNKRDATMPPSKMDVATGISRTVVPEIAEVSQDSYIMTAAIGSVLLIVIGAVTFASRRGAVDFEKIIEIIYSDSVTCMFDIVVGIGDTTAFTVSVFTLVAVDNALIQVLPACYLFLAFAWVGSLYNAYHDSNQLYTVWFQHFKETLFIDSMSFRMATSMIKKVRAEKQMNSILGKPVDAPDIRNHLAQHVRVLCNERSKYDALLELELSTRDLRRKRGDIITIMSESIPITAIQCYIMAEGGDTQIVTILVMFFSSSVFGAKIASLGSYKETRERRVKAQENFMTEFGVCQEESKLGGDVAMNATLAFGLRNNTPLHNIPPRDDARDVENPHIPSYNTRGVEYPHIPTDDDSDVETLIQAYTEVAVGVRGSGVEDWGAHIDHTVHTGIINL